MSDDNVSEYACGKVHPFAPAKCVRKRWHAGDHRAAVEGRMQEWPDESRDELGRFADGRHVPRIPTPKLVPAPLLFEPSPFPTADELTELDPVTYDGELDVRRAWGAPLPPAWAWALFALLMPLYVLSLVAAFRAAF